MALAKKNRRSITVRGCDYWWKVAPDDEPGMAIVVMDACTGQGQRMITWVDHGNIISPWLVSLSIERAIDAGWRPQAKGPDVIFRLDGIHSPPGKGEEA